MPGDHDPGVLDPLHCYNPCKYWLFPGFCPLHQTLQVATPVTNGGAASRNRTDARLDLSTFRDTGGRDRLLTPALSSVEEERENPLADV